MARRDRAAPGTAAAPDTRIVITRDFDAPRKLVWRAWTEPALLMRWWGPGGFTAPVCRVDLRVGGSYLFCMRSPEGKDYWSTGIYREIVEPERIVFTDFFADEEGNPVPATHYGMSPDWPAEMLVRVTFAEHEDKTKLTLQHLGIPSGAEGDSCEAGWTESLERLAEHLAKALSQAQTPSARAARAA